ncbi:hypothetical protein Q9L58_010863 [Maublancomyces gigas]|uniref:Uncharacterized protein n=1 Tax=Discina gigas TaxID=1032678 RepID=A0ABR3G2X0_9PEZI
MAWYFQCWYQACVQRGTVTIGDVELAASVPEFELFMDDILAIIGKKSTYPFDPRPYIAWLLDIKSYCSLRSNLRPEAGCEAFLCKDVGEHSAQVRMAMFALLGLFLKLPNCVCIWRLSGVPIFDDNIERFWRSMHSDAVRMPSYLDWLKARADGWSAPIRAHFRVGHSDRSVWYGEAALCNLSELNNRGEAPPGCPQEKARLVEISSLQDGVGVNGRVPPGPDRYANLLNAERRVEPVLVHYLLSQFELSWYWDVDDDLDPDKMWYAWLDGVIPGAGGI